MAYLVEDFRKDWEEANIDGLWVLARPVIGPFLWRLRDAWQVLIGKADAVTFYKQ